jgi:hypothetical protein
MKMLLGSSLGFCKIIPEAACEKLILAHFPVANDNIDQSQRREFEVSVSVFKISK